MEINFKESGDDARSEADILGALRESKLFAELELAALLAISARAEVVEFEAGHVVITEGMESDDVYLILRGQAAVQVESINPPMEIGIARLGAGEIVGEIALLGNAPRSASVVAMQHVQLARFDSDDLLEIFQDQPTWGMIFMRNLAAILANRLKLMNRRVLNMTRSQFFT